MTNKVIIFEGIDCSDEMDQTPLTMRPNKTRCRDGIVKTKNDKDGESNESPNDSPIENGSQTNTVSRYASYINNICFILDNWNYFIW